MRFENKVAIVTGAVSGIGLATANRLAREGARVVIADLDEAKVQAVAAHLKKCGAPDALGVVCDVSKEEQVEAAVASTRERFGALHVIVNNAGTMIFKPLEEHTEDDWMKILQVDLLGA